MPTMGNDIRERLFSQKNISLFSSECRSIKCGAVQRNDPIGTYAPEPIGAFDHLIRSGPISLSTRRLTDRMPRFHTARSIACDFASDVNECIRTFPDVERSDLSGLDGHARTMVEVGVGSSDPRLQGREFTPGCRLVSLSR